MMQKYSGTAFICALAFLFSPLSHAEQLNTEQKNEVQQIIKIFKSKNIASMSKHIDYPLIRETPIPAIKNSTEMNIRFKQVFDDKLINRIAQSKLSQWSSVGWRGVMLNNGEVWLNGDKISAVNLSNTAEQTLKKQLIAKQKSQLHPSLKQFKQPELLFKTSKYQIRIDQLNNGQYRYASWKIGKSQSAQPDLILTHGEREYDGSGGNHTFNFNSGHYHYQVYRMLIGSDESNEVSLLVKKDHVKILEQAGVILD